jgi:hypothetical protein
VILLHGTEAVVSVSVGPNCSRDISVAVCYSSLNKILCC